MKEIKKQRVSYDISWEAIDGTSFNNEEECRKYENTARMVLWARLKEFIVAEDNEFSLFRVGNDYDKVFAVKILTPEACDTVTQLWLLDCGVKDDISEVSEDSYVGRALATIKAAYTNKDILLVGASYDDGNSIYIIDTRQNILNRLLNLDKDNGSKDNKAD